MKLLALVLSHRTLPIRELERVTVPETLLPGALPCLLRAPDVREAVILSTCNRTEVYAWVGDPEAAAREIRLFLEGLKGLPPGWTERRGRILVGEEVIRHLFEVAAGLDSMARGEAEIQGQVRAAYRVAAAAGAVGPHLHGLFRWALEAGKRARAATGLSREREGIPRAAVRAIEAALGALAGREVVVVGSGRIAAGSVRALARAGARPRVVARRAETARELAERFGGVGLPLAALVPAMAAADAVVFATAAPAPLAGPEEISRALAGRDGPLVVVDLGLPRNVDPAVLALRGPIVLYDLERLEREGFTAPGGREAQLAEASEIVLVEAERCVAWFRSRPADRVVAAIQARAARIARAEAEDALRRIPGLDERQREAVARAIHRSVRKVVHLPTVRAKEACARGDDGLVEAARWLFGVDGEPAEPARGTHRAEEVG
ncbi:MAG TPA: glutamyl-tRNA reductase [Actinomycetota bacterium]|nr:glutamyl-tRNA reductase [Actinomycetota bacterium]